MIEQVVEEYLVKRVRETGGEVRKLQWIGRRGAPDRFVGWPNGKHGLVELKRPKGREETHQLREHCRLRAVGMSVDVINTKEKVDWFVERMTR